jgi:hypothetical protein
MLIILLIWRIQSHTSIQSILFYSVEYTGSESFTNQTWLLTISRWPLNNVWCMLFLRHGLFWGRHDGLSNMSSRSSKPSSCTSSSAESSAFSTRKALPVWSNRYSIPISSPTIEDNFPYVLSQNWNNVNPTRNKYKKIKKKFCFIIWKITLWILYEIISILSTCVCIGFMCCWKIFCPSSSSDKELVTCLSLQQ